MFSWPRRLARPDRLYALGSFLLFGMLLAGVLAIVRSFGDDGQQTLQLQALGDSMLSVDQKSLRIGYGESAARLHLQLPTHDAGVDRRWMIWMPRAGADEVWLQGPGWQSPHYDFFAPDPSEGALASGFFFALPPQWQGPIDLELHARGAVKGLLSPRLVPEEAHSRIIARTVTMNAFVYATLFVLGLVALQLYVASKQSAFVALFASAILALLMVLSHNGHAYGVPALEVLRFWRGHGLWVLELFYTTAMLQLLMRYAIPTGESTHMVVLINYCSGGLIALAVLCLIGGSVLPSKFLETLVTVGWIASSFALVVFGFDALRRNVTLVRTVFALGVATIGALLARESLSRGYIADTMTARYGYQLMIVVLMGVVATALIARIAEYRKQRDRLRVAHRDVEERLNRETALAGLAATLRSQLRNASPADIETTVMRVLFEHLRPLLPTDGLALVAEGYLGRDLLCVEPKDLQAQVSAQIAARDAELRREASGRLPQQRSLRDAHGRAMVEAMVPMRLRAPAWGALLMQRSGEEGFSHCELTIAGQMLEVAVQQSMDALATLQLRRSAEIDALTGTFNRRTIDLWLGQTFRQAYQENRPVSVLFVDIDRFKSINDRYGHGCGDRCLRHVASILHGKLGQEGLLGRYGGEEFVILLPGHDAAQARGFAEALREAVQSVAIACNDKTIKATVSIGVACRLPDESTPQPTLERADKALYAAKRGGRNCVQVAPAVFK